MFIADFLHRLIPNGACRLEKCLYLALCHITVLCQKVAHSFLLKYTVYGIMIFSPTLPGEIYRFTESSVPHFKHCISPSCKPLFRIKRCPRMKPVRQLNRYRKTNEPAYFHTETDSLTITVAFTAYRQRYKPPIEQPYRDSHVFRKPEERERISSGMCNAKKQIRL